MKVILICMLTMFLISGAMAIIPSGSVRSDGDSFLLAVSGQNPDYNNTFIERFTKYYSLNLTNAGVGGSNSSMVLSYIYTQVSVPSPYDNHVINSGYADIKRRWQEEEVPNATANRIGAMVAFIRTNNIKKGTNSFMNYTGPWIRTVANYTDSYSLVVNSSRTTGDTMQATITGDMVSIGILNYPGRSPLINVSVDNEVTYIYGADNYGAIQCPTANKYCAAAIEVRMSPGTHDIVIQNVNGEQFAVDWFGYGNYEDVPFVIVNGVTKVPNYPTDRDIAVDRMNVALQRNLAVFDEKVVYVNQDSWDAEQLPLIGSRGVDITHPNNFGHALMFQNIRDTL